MLHFCSSRMFPAGPSVKERYSVLVIAFIIAARSESSDESGLADVWGGLAGL
jgi:hypothetical protein